jgi:hypothetical protein
MVLAYHPDLFAANFQLPHNILLFSATDSDNVRVPGTAVPVSW